MRVRFLVALLAVVAITAVSCHRDQPTIPTPEMSAQLSLGQDYDSAVIGAEIAEYFANHPAPAPKAPADVTVNVEISQPVDGYMTEDECVNVVGTASAVGGAAIDLHLVLDTSGSLSWNDPSDFREQAAVALIQAFNPAANITVGTIDFDDNCFIASPLTLIGADNGAAAIAAVQAMDQSGGTAIDCGINLAVNDFLANGRPGATHVILLFSDGESSAAPAMAAAANAAANNVVVNTVFLGGAGSTLMQNIATATGGFYLQTNNPQDLIDLFGTGPVTGITGVTVNGQPANLVAGTFSIELCLACGPNTITAVATATDGTTGSDEITVTRICEIEVPVDIKPTSCPNPLNPKSNGVVPVAILGTADFDVTQIDPASIKLEGLEPIRWHLDDVATPYYPLRGKTGCRDCTTMGPDGYMDLTLKFKTQQLVTALGMKEPGCIVLTLTGKLKPEFGGYDIIGEDVMRLKIPILPELWEDK